VKKTDGYSSVESDSVIICKDKATEKIQSKKTYDSDSEEATAISESSHKKYSAILSGAFSGNFTGCTFNVNLKF
jgi:hypothetical protein